MSSRKSSSWSLFLWFVLAVALILGAVVTDQTATLEFNVSSGGWGMQANLQWMFWLLLALAVFCLSPLLDHLLGVLARRGLLPESLTNRLVGESGEAAGLEHFWRQMRNPVGRLLTAGFAIFGIIFIVSKSNAVREMEVDSYVYEYLSGKLSGRPHWPVNPQQITTSLSINMHGLNDSLFFSDVLKVVRDLKDVGARAVMIDIRGAGEFMKNYESLRQIEETGISVFGMLERSAISVDFSDLNTKDPRGQLVVSKGAITIKPSELAMNPFLFRFKPEIEGSGGAKVLDVTLELFRKYHGYPADMNARRSGNSLVFGNYEIPLGRDDCAYSKQSILTWFNPKVSIVKEGGSDALKYKGWIKSQNKRAVGGIRDFRDNFAGKIVFLERSELEGMENNWMLTDSYRSAMQVMWEGKLITRSHTLHVWVTLVCIVMSGFIAFRLRAIPGMLTIFALGCAVLLGCWLVYYKLNILIDIFYPLLATIMSMFVFPAFTATDEHREV
jgi:hypothetical protein